MATITIPTMRDFWKAVFLFAYRRWVRPGENKPVGIPGNRDTSDDGPLSEDEQKDFDAAWKRITAANPPDSSEPPAKSA